MAQRDGELIQQYLLGGPDNPMPDWKGNPSHADGPVAGLTGDDTQLEGQPAWIQPA